MAKTHPRWKREVPADFWIIKAQVSSDGFDESDRSQPA
jgi:hypothetical protein